MPVIFVVPVTLNVNVEAVANDVPLPIVRFPVTDKLAAVVAAAVPLNVKLFPMLVVPDCMVLVPLPAKVRL